MSCRLHAATIPVERRPDPARCDAVVLGAEELAVVVAVRAPTGDLRDRDARGTWAEEIARAWAALVRGPGVPGQAEHDLVAVRGGPGHLRDRAPPGHAVARGRRAGGR